MSIARVVACAILMAALVAGVVASPASADEPNQINYSPQYFEYLSVFPVGYASNGCVLAVEMSGASGVGCTTELAPVWFYPDGTLGDWPWRIDPSAPAGWSLEPHPCDGFEDPYADRWWPLYIAYLDWLYGLTDVPPDGITDQQAGCLIFIYGF